MEGAISEEGRQRHNQGFSQLSYWIYFQMQNNLSIPGSGKGLEEALLKVQ